MKNRSYFNWPENRLRNLYNSFKERAEKYGLYSPYMIADIEKRPDLPKNLLIYRIMVGLNREEFCRKYNLNISSYSNLENGKTYLKNVETAEKYIKPFKLLLKNRPLFTFDGLHKQMYILKKQIQDRERQGGYTQAKLYKEKKKIWGKKAGESTLKRHGVEHFKKISKLSNSVPHKRIDLKKKYGKDFYSNMGKKGMEKFLELYKHKKREWGLKSAENFPLSKQEKRLLRMFHKASLYPEVHKTIIDNNKVIGNFDFFFKKLNLIIEVSQYAYKDESLSKFLYKISRIKKLRKFNCIFIIPLKSPVESILTLLNNKFMVVFDVRKNLDILIDNIKHSNLWFDYWKSRTLQQMKTYLNDTSCRRNNGGIARKNQKLDNYEKLVEDKLKEKKVTCIPRFVLNGPFGLKRVADFFLKISSRGYLIEVTKAKNLEYAAKRLLGKFFAYRKYYKPKTKFIGIIFCDEKPSKHLFETNFYIRRLINIADHIIINDMDALGGILK